MTAPVYLLVQGMHLRADSIAYDTAFQYRLFKSWGVPVEVFAETFDAKNYPGIEAKPFADLAQALERAPGPVIYHWVDGWKEGDEFLLRTSAPVVLRWHNNTPPWFFASYSFVPTHKTVRGFLELLRVAEALPNARLWTNSEFSRRQLATLGIDDSRVDVVYPASAYLEAKPILDRGERPQDADRPIRILFVGRVVPHKGHLHLLAAGRAVAEMSGREVCVVLPGRPDSDMARYVPEVQALAHRLDVTVEIPGEVSHEGLASAYRDADVFVGLSEHEGFGLPILEAMTRGLPVVGYRSSAVAELLNSHPLAVDGLDPVGIARRVIAALDPTARQALVTWQARAVLPRFSGSVITAQLRTHASPLGFGPGVPNEPSTSEPTNTPCPPEVRAALEKAVALPAPRAALPRDLPRDLNPHFVTRYDLESYRALLAQAGRGDLRGRALGIEFGSHRPTFGGVMGLLKTGILRLQDGLIRTIEMSHDDLASQLHKMSERVDLLSVELKKLTRDEKKER